LFECLPNEQAGKLIKHIFKYVNDENPECDDALVNLAFVSIKASLKRDLNKWEKQIEQRSAAGKASAEKRKQSATKFNEIQRPLKPVHETQRNSTDSVSVSVSVNDNVINKDIPFNFKTSLINLGVQKEIVDDWLKVRKTKKAANTETAFKAICREIEKSKLTPNDCIKKAVENSWSGFKNDWLQNNGFGNSQPQTRPLNKLN
jgi:hypothetical protein